MKQQVHLLIGPIASGKSTYALNAAKRGFVVINDDAITTMLHGGDYRLYSKDCEPIYKATQLAIFTHALSIGKSVVVDVGNRKRHIRDRWNSLAMGYNVPTYGIVFPKEDPETHARRRYDSDHRDMDYQSWLEVAKAQEATYQNISSTENFTDVEYAVWDKVKSGWIFEPTERV